MIELDDLRSFVEVVEAGGFSRAATHLGISKSIVSRRIARLEAEFGTRLLSRTTRGISPTESGLELKARGDRILAELDEAREALALQGGGGVVGRLRVSLPISFGVRHVTPLLADLARRHPKLEMEVSYSDRIVDLIGERFDAAVRIGALKDSTLVARRIAPVRAIVVASPDYLARKGRPQTPADLDRHDCLIYTGVTPSWQFRSGKRTIAVRPEGRLKSDSSDALLQWAIAGLGIANLPSFYLADAIEAGALTPLLLDHPQPEFAIHVVLPPGAFVPGKTRALVDALVQRFKGEPDWDRCLMKTEPKKRRA